MSLTECCNEDLRIKALILSFRQIFVWSWINRKEIFPKAQSMLNRFDLEFYSRLLSFQHKHIAKCTQRETSLESSWKLRYIKLPLILSTIINRKLFSKKNLCGKLIRPFYSLQFAVRTPSKSSYAWICKNKLSLAYLWNNTPMLSPWD